MTFDRPSLQTLIDRAEAELAARLGLGPLLPRSILATLARVTAGQAHQLHAHLLWVLDQFFPDTADAEHLERFAAIFGILRKAAAKATGDVTFTGTSGSALPLGTAVRRADGVEFVTTIGVILSGGTANAPVEASVAGEAGDTAAATAVTLVSPVAGVNADAVVAAGGLGGGTDRETDVELRDRLLQHIQNPPQGGSVADYEAWTLEVSEVTRAFAIEAHAGAGTVGVTFLIDDDPSSPIPLAPKIAEVQAYLDDPSRRPVTAVVSVFAPVAVDIDPEIVVVPDTPEVRTAVEASLEDMLRARVVPGTDVPLSWITEAISAAAGETSHTLVSPVAPVVAAAGEIVLLGTITWS